VVNRSEMMVIKSDAAPVTIKRTRLRPIYWWMKKVWHRGFILSLYNTGRQVDRYNKVSTRRDPLITRASSRSGGDVWSRNTAHTGIDQFHSSNPTNAHGSRKRSFIRKSRAGCLYFVVFFSYLVNIVYRKRRSSW